MLGIETSLLRHHRLDGKDGRLLGIVRGSTRAIGGGIEIYGSGITSSSHREALNGHLPGKARVNAPPLVECLTTNSPPE